MKHNRVLSYVLVALSGVFLAVTVYVILTYGRTAYFVTFHKPFHMDIFSTHHRPASAELPVFQVTPTLGQSSLTVSGTQTIAVQTSVNHTTRGYLEVWITSPTNHQVYRSPMSQIETFSPNQPQSFNFSYAIPNGSPIGVYRVSDLITSPDTETDYYVNEDFGSFTIH